MSFIQELNSKINQHHKLFVTEMEEMFIKNDIKARIIRDFNKADFNIKLKDNGSFEENYGLSNYKTGDYVNFTFYSMAVKISLRPIHNLETNTVSDYDYNIAYSTSGGDYKPYTNNDYKQYIINDAAKYEYGLLKVKDSQEYDKLVTTFYNSLQRVLGGHDGVF